MYSKREQLIRDGYCVFENVLTPEMVERTNAASNRLLDAQDAEYFEAQKSTGSLISIYHMESHSRSGVGVTKRKDKT